MRGVSAKTCHIGISDLQLFSQAAAHLLGAEATPERSVCLQLLILVIQPARLRARDDC
eukprot:COSAG05_NODE_2391_length_3127_cov_4.498349_2_plen_58_part_00